ncbi:unnamed protein product [Cladocopium goreaui]|uniref:GDP-mannose 4,6-dehydratase n=1 Tax=Cladocopium goreaui TaxID=2562237 RepID=A0A9P1D829_9DINO|nr:unnamed protein product [Cladocopium goreaui]
MRKTALITGITGQDGSYLAEFLLEKGYEVHGILRRSSSFNTSRIDHIFDKVNLHYGDLVDSSNLASIMAKVKPDEVYNLAAQSHVKVSFEEPEYTAQADGVGTLRLLEAIRTVGLEKTTRFYQASTSELYGMVQEEEQEELEVGNVIRVPEREQVGMKWRRMVRCGPQGLLSVSGKSELQGETLKMSVGRYDVEVVSRETTQRVDVLESLSDVEMVAKLVPREIEELRETDKDFRLPESDVKRHQGRKTEHPDADRGIYLQLENGSYFNVSRFQEMPLGEWKRLVPVMKKLARGASVKIMVSWQLFDLGGALNGRCIACAPKIFSLVPPFCSRLCPS